MPFPFVIRKLTKILRNEQIIAARGADRFAEGRVKELKEAIGLLSGHTIEQQHTRQAERKAAGKRTATLKEFIHQIPLFK